MASQVSQEVISPLFSLVKKKKKKNYWGQMICTGRMRGEAFCEMSSDRKREKRTRYALPPPLHKITQFSCYCGLWHVGPGHVGR